MAIPGILKKKRVFIGIPLILILIAGFFFMQSQGAAKKAAEEKAAAEAPESPYAAVANGKADVEGGIIQVAARRGGVVKEVYVQEGDRVVAGQILARQEDDEARLAYGRAAAGPVAQDRDGAGVRRAPADGQRRDAADCDGETLQRRGEGASTSARDGRGRPGGAGGCC